MRPQRKEPGKEDYFQLIRENKDSDQFYIGLVDHSVGRGVFAENNFNIGDFLVQFCGELKTCEECEDVEDTYMFEFQHKGKSYVIDASEEDGSFGRLINDETKKPNCVPKVIVVDQKLVICFFALRSISKGEELRYNYGKGDYAWRKKGVMCSIECVYMDCPVDSADLPTLTIYDKILSDTIKTVQRWSKNEKEAALRQLGDFIAKRKCPGKFHCDTAKGKEPALKNRTWIQLKNFIRNRIVQSSKIKFKAGSTLLQQKL